MAVGSSSALALIVTAPPQLTIEIAGNICITWWVISRRPRWGRRWDIFHDSTDVLGCSSRLRVGGHDIVGMLRESVAICVCLRSIHSHRCFGRCLAKCPRYTRVGTTLVAACSRICRIKTTAVGFPHPLCLCRMPGHVPGDWARDSPTSIDSKKSFITCLADTCPC